MKKYPTSFYMNEEMRKRMDESFIKKTYGVSDYLRTAVAKFQEYEEQERKQNDEMKREK